MTKTSLPVRGLFEWRGMSYPLRLTNHLFCLKYPNGFPFLPQFPALVEHL
jgi:hypothetical protein